VKPLRLLIMLGICCNLLTGCKLGPNYERPELEAPEDFAQDIDEGAVLSNLPWWQVFDDPDLVELINLALAENKELAIATARRDEVRARLGFTRADLYPQLDGVFDAGRGNAPNLQNPAGGTSDNFVLAAEAFYEVDLFGRVRRSTEAAQADLFASEANRQTVVTAVIADVASTYFLLRDLDARYEISERTLKTRQDSTNIIRERFNKGIVPILDVNQAEIEEADSAAILAALARQQVTTENLLSVLIGRNPGPILRNRSLADQTLIPSVPAGLPSELLERRPDLKAAEQVLAAQTARIGVAEALRWPSLSLTGTIGLASDDLSDLLDADDLWNVNASVFAPVFNAGRNKRRAEIAQAQAEQALESYELAVLSAFAEVEDSLAAIRNLKDEYEARQRQVTAARSAATLSRARYDGGVTSYLEVLDSERSLFTAEIAASQVRRAQLVSIVDLYKALGGGWDAAEN
jgi:multidrug efflux system outer membrane protein